jgi:WD40 repeat protein
VAFTVDGRLVSAGDDGKVRIWDVATGRELHTLAGHRSRVVGLAVSANGKRVATASWDGTVRLWATDTGGEIRSLAVGGGSMLCVAQSPDGHRVAGGDSGGQVTVWDAETGRVIRTLPGIEGSVQGVAFSPNGQFLAVIGGGATLRVWMPEQGTQILTLKGHAPSAVAYTPDGRCVTTAGPDGTVRVWAVTPSRLPQRRAFLGGAQIVALSPDGRTWAGGLGGNTDIELRDPTLLRPLFTLKGLPDFPRCLAFSSSGQVVAGARNGVVARWDVTTGKYQGAFIAHDASVEVLAFTADRRRLASAAMDGTVRVFDAQSQGRLLDLLGRRGESALSLAFSPDGARLAAGCWDGQSAVVRVWDTATGKEVCALPAGADPVVSLAFGSGGRVAGGSRGRMVRLWETATSREVFSRPGHADEVLGLAFSPDGQRLISGSKDQTVRIWDTEFGQELLTLRVPRVEVVGVVLTADGKQLVALGAQGDIHTWYLTPGPLPGGSR